MPCIVQLYLYSIQAVRFQGRGIISLVRNKPRHIKRLLLLH